MSALQTAEKQIGSFFKNMPALPKQSKEALVKAWPWIALVFGVLQLLAAYWLVQSARAVENLNQLTNALSQYYSGATVGLSAMDKSVIYLGVGILIIDGVILLMAYPHLKQRARRGWDLLFIASLINVVYAVISAFMAYRGGVGSLFFGVLSSAIGFYLLFQVREFYGSHASRSTSV